MSKSKTRKSAKVAVAVEAPKPKPKRRRAKNGRRRRAKMAGPGARFQAKMHKALDKWLNAILRDLVLKILKG